MFRKIGVFEKIVILRARDICVLLCCFDERSDLVGGIFKQDLIGSGSKWS